MVDLATGEITVDRGRIVQLEGFEFGALSSDMDTDEDLEGHSDDNDEDGSDDTRESVGQKGEEKELGEDDAAHDEALLMDFMAAEVNRRAANALTDGGNPILVSV